MGTIRELQSNITIKKVTRTSLGSNLTWGTTGHGCGTDTNDSGWHLKTETPIYRSVDHMVVTRNGVDLVYDTDWNWGDSIPGGIGDMSDSIRFNIGSIGVGDTYELTYSELQSSYIPILSGYRTDGRDITNTQITPRMWFHEEYGSLPCNDIFLVLWEVARVADLAYEAKYAMANPAIPPYGCERVIQKVYPTHFRVRDFEDNVAFPSGWRMEFYNVGKIHGKGNSPSGNINLNPLISSSVNRIQIGEGGNYKYNLYVRLRDVNKNMVTQFSTRKIYSKRRYAWQYGNFGDSPIGVYYKSGII